MTKREKKEFEVTNGFKLLDESSRQVGFLTYDWEEDDRTLVWDSVFVHKPFRGLKSRKLYEKALAIVNGRNPAIMFAESQSEAGEKLFKSFCQKTGVGGIDAGVIDRVINSSTAKEGSWQQFV